MTTAAMIQPLITVPNPIPSKFLPSIKLSGHAKLCRFPLALCITNILAPSHSVPLSFLLCASSTAYREVFCAPCWKGNIPHWIQLHFNYKFNYYRV